MADWGVVIPAPGWLAWNPMDMVVAVTVDTGAGALAGMVPGPPMLVCCCEAACGRFAPGKEVLTPPMPTLPVVLSDVADTPPCPIPIPPDTPPCPIPIPPGGLGMGLTPGTPPPPTPPPPNPAET